MRLGRKHLSCETVTEPSSNVCLCAQVIILYGQSLELAGSIATDVPATFSYLRSNHVLWESIQLFWGYKPYCCDVYTLQVGIWQCNV